MKKATINGKQVAFFETDLELIEWAEFVLKSAKENNGIYFEDLFSYNDDVDVLIIYLTDGAYNLSIDDLNELDKLNLYA